MSTTTSNTTIGAINVVCVPVSDVDVAIDFYCGKLGYEKRADIPMGDQYRWVEVAAPGAETTIAISPPPPGQEAGNAQTGIILRTTDIEAVRDDLAAKGVDIDAEVSRMGDPVPPLCWFRDPDNNVLMLVEVPAS